MSEVNLSSNYISVESGLYLNKSLHPEDVKTKIRDLRYAFFDFDGTLYPGMIILEMANSIISDYAKNGDSLYSSKLSLLSELVQKSKEMPFPKVADEFVKILDGMNVHDFEIKLPSFLSKKYPSGLTFVEKLSSIGVSCYVVSLTADFVADRISEEYPLVSCSSMKYAKLKRGNSFYLSGRFDEPLFDTVEFKNAQLREFSLKNFTKKNSLMAGDSVDDSGIMTMCGIKIGVNPTPELISKCEPDIVLRSKGDPWLPLINYV